MVNLAGPRPLGNSIESMDLGFALQARCLEAVANGAVGAGSVRRARAARDRRARRGAVRRARLSGDSAEAEDLEGAVVW